MLRFTKMNGAGNDFVMVDNRGGNVRLEPNQIARICDRHRGVGADGILLLEKGSNGADFRMRYYNRDGGEAEMCGNGARCFARYVERTAGVKGQLTFETKAGIQSAFVFWGALTRPLLELAVDCIPAQHLRLVFERLLADIRAHRSGLPDLIQLWPVERRYRLIEVKGPGDRLQDNQLRWLDFCRAHEIPVCVCKVTWRMEAA